MGWKSDISLETTGGDPFPEQIYGETKEDAEANARQYIGNAFTNGYEREHRNGPPTVYQLRSGSYTEAVDDPGAS